MRLYLLAVVAVLCVTFLGCDKDSTPVIPPGSNPPPVSLPTGIHLAIGNKYYWHFVQFNNHGGFFIWDQTDSIVGETTIGENHYYVFNNGRKLRSAGDTVYSYESGGSLPYYRFDVDSGQTAPFMGTTLRVSSVTGDSVFGEYEKVVVLESSSYPNGVYHGRYSTRFGILGYNVADSSSVVQGLLTGVQMGNANFGLSR